MKRSHNVFHVSKLKKYVKEGKAKGPMSVVVDPEGTTEQVVTAILDKKRSGRQVFYLTLFDNDPKSEAVWLSKSELKNCMELVNEFNKSQDPNVRQGRRTSKER